jgi:hypothetical protein
MAVKQIARPRQRQDVDASLRIMNKLNVDSVLMNTPSRKHDGPNLRDNQTMRDLMAADVVLHRRRVLIERSVQHEMVLW